MSLGRCCLGLFSRATLFASTIQCPDGQQETTTYSFLLSELMYSLLAGKDQSQADQPNRLAEIPPCKYNSKSDSLHLSIRIFLTRSQVPFSQ